MAVAKSKVIDWGGFTVKVNNIELGCRKGNDGRSGAQLSNNNGVIMADDGTLGTVGAATVSADEYGFGNLHHTKLTCTAFAIGTTADNAALAFGAKFYTMPAGAVIIHRATIVGGITAAISVTTNTPEVGIGTVVASGANATLTTATWENVMDGGATIAGLGDGASVAPDVAGGIFRKTSLSTVSPIIKASGGLSHDLYLNIAATWADVTAAGAATFTGTIDLDWTYLGAV